MEQYDIIVGGGIGTGIGPFLKAIVKPPVSDILLDVFPKNDGRFTTGYYPTVVDIAVLTEFYGNMSRSALSTQLHFLRGRIEANEVSRNHMGIAVRARSVMEDLEVFAGALVDKGIMSEGSRRAYTEVFDRTAAHIPRPGLYVIFTSTVQSQMIRILEAFEKAQSSDSDEKLSLAEAEQNIPPAYLRALNRRIESFVAGLKCPKIVVNTTYADVRSEAFHEEVAHRIAGLIKSCRIPPTVPGISNWLTVKDQDEVGRMYEDVKARLSHYLKKNQKIITIAGQVGLGKTTLADLIKKELGIGITYENPAANPILSDFLRDKPAHCYRLQEHFLKMRYAQRTAALKDGVSFVEDRSPSEDLIAFSRRFWSQEFLTEEQYISLEQKFIMADQQNPSADLMIVLQGTPAKAWQRIRDRGVLEELKYGWTREEIFGLGKWYANFGHDVQHYEIQGEPIDGEKKYSFHRGPVLVLDQERLKTGLSIGHTGYFFEQMLKMLEGNGA